MEPGYYIILQGLYQTNSAINNKQYKVELQCYLKIHHTNIYFRNKGGLPKDFCC